jgi:hypothetical protein
MGIILTVAFNFLDIEDLDADYERSIEQAERVAAAFQALASKASLGQSFLSTAPDQFAFYIHRVLFENGTDEPEAKAGGAVEALAHHCRNRLLKTGVRIGRGPSANQQHGGTPLEQSK